MRGKKNDSSRGAKRSDRNDRPNKNTKSFSKNAPGRGGDGRNKRDEKPAFGTKKFGGKPRTREEKPFSDSKTERDGNQHGPRKFEHKPAGKNFSREENIPAHANFYKKKFKKPKGRNAEDLTSTSGEIRLNRFISIAGVASRREADKLIEMGLVTVNGKPITEMGYKVKSTDDVRYQGTRIRAEKKVYVLMNKPKGFITTMEDPKARKTVMDILAGNVKERIYPVGRLDRATTGVLLLTNDGDLAKKLTHPSHGAKKIYAASLDKNLTKADMDAIAKGLELEDGLAEVDAIDYIADKSKSNIGLEIHIGRNRIVRRIFKHLGYEVSKLDRSSFAGLTKKNLNRGQWRYLTDKEVNYLKML